MEFGAHLPLMDFGGHPYTLDHLLDYTKTDHFGFTPETGVLLKIVKGEWQVVTD